MVEKREKSVNSKAIILKAMDRIHNLCSATESEDQYFLKAMEKKLQIGVNGLECMLGPFIDQGYTDAIETQVKAVSKDMKNYTESEHFFFFKWKQLALLINRQKFAIENEGIQ